jgi:hypothetical protein
LRPPPPWKKCETELDVAVLPLPPVPLDDPDEPVVPVEVDEPPEMPPVPPDVPPVDPEPPDPPPPPEVVPVGLGAGEELVRLGRGVSEGSGSVADAPVTPPATNHAWGAATRAATTRPHH